MEAGEGELRFGRTTEGGIPRLRSWVEGCANRGRLETGAGSGTGARGWV